MQKTRVATYTGWPPFASMLVHDLQRRGVTVEWEPPLKERGVEEDVRAVVIGIVASGSVEVIKAACRAFVRRRPRAKVEVDGENQEPDDEP
jgi:hypothetical protein